MSEQVHPDWDAAPADHRWGDSLTGLKAALRAAAFRARGRVVWYVLPRGAILSMRVDVKAFPHRELRIARSAAPKDAAGRAAWEREIDVFRRYLGAEDWSVARQGVTPTGGIEIVLREVLTIGKSEGLKCADCGDPAQPGPYKEPRCVACAIKAGNAEIAARGNNR